MIYYGCSLNENNYSRYGYSNNFLAKVREKLGENIPLHVLSKTLSNFNVPSITIGYTKMYDKNAVNNIINGNGCICVTDGRRIHVTWEVFKNKLIQNNTKPVILPSSPNDSKPLRIQDPPIYNQKPKYAISDDSGESYAEWFKKQQPRYNSYDSYKKMKKASEELLKKDN